MVESLKNKLRMAALELMSKAGADEFNSFDLVAGGRRLVIEVALLPPVSRASEGALRAKPETRVERPVCDSRRAILAERD
jgi:hypothetical protein